MQLQALVSGYWLQKLSVQGLCEGRGVPRGARVETQPGRKEVRTRSAAGYSRASLGSVRTQTGLKSGLARIEEMLEGGEAIRDLLRQEIERRV